MVIANRFFAFVFLLFALSSSAAESIHVVTYEFSGGRFGDNILSYLHAKWLSYTYGIPLLYKQFTYSPHLVLHEKEIKFQNSHYSNRRRTGFFNIDDVVHSSDPMLFICPYFPEDPIERIEEKYAFFDVDWKDPQFRKIALEMIAPTKELRLVEPPEKTVNLAIHVRLGENYDDNAFRNRFPLKLPPLEFYLEVFPKVLELFRGKPIYCYVFTDAEYPERIVKALETLVPPDISLKFGYRKGRNLQNWNVLDDFFSFFNFDALIRSQSHFSLIPSLLHDFAVLCYPSEFTRENDWPEITRFEIEVNEPLYQKLMEEK